MPIIYHHTQYPYRDIEKFKIRSHKFIKFGMIPGAITMNLGLFLGLKFSLHAGIGSSYEHFSYILAIVPFVLVYIFLNIENEFRFYIRKSILNCCLNIKVCEFVRKQINK